MHDRKCNPAPLDHTRWKPQNNVETPCKTDTLFFQNPRPPLRFNWMIHLVRQVPRLPAPLQAY